MPELPEVETVKETLKTLVIGTTIKNVDLIYPNIVKRPNIKMFKDIVKNQTINDITRRGKYLIFHLDDYYLISHLRMEGKYFIKHDEEIEKHEHVIFHLSDERTMRYHDVRKFGTMDLISKRQEINEFLSHIGPEPFSDEFNKEYLFNKAKNKSKNIKGFLLDQGVVAGIGNIYVNEICFLTRINPMRIVSTLSLDDFERIVEATKKVLNKAIKLGGTTIRSYTSSLGVTGRFQNELLVHGKAGENCPECGEIIFKIKVNGRGTYYCDNCQK